MHGDDVSGNGSSICPFATVTKALTVATTAGQGTGPQVSTIDLAPGTYSSETFPLEVTTPTSIQGESSSSTTIVHAGSGLAVWLFAQGSGISGVTLQGDGSPASIGVEAFTCGESIVGSQINGFGRGVHEWITMGPLPCVTIDSNVLSADVVSLQLDGSSAQVTNNRISGGGVFIQDESGFGGSFPVLLSGNSFDNGTQASEICPEPAACDGTGGCIAPQSALPSGVAICIQGTSGATLDPSASRLDGGAGNLISGARTGLLFLSNGNAPSSDGGPIPNPTIVESTSFVGNADYGVWVGSGGQTWALDLGSINTEAGFNTFSCNGAADVWLGGGTTGTLTAEFDDWDHAPPTQSTTSCTGGVDVCSAGSGGGTVDSTSPITAASPCP